MLQNITLTITPNMNISISIVQRYKLIIKKEQIDIVIVCSYQVIGLVMRSLEFYKMNKT